MFLENKDVDDCETQIDLSNRTFNHRACVYVNAQYMHM